MTTRIDWDAAILLDGPNLYPLDPIDLFECYAEQRESGIWMLPWIQPAPKLEMRWVYIYRYC